MTTQNKTPHYHIETHELLGVVVKENNSWVAQTIFGYTIERTTSRKDAESALQSKGLDYLKGVWQYFETSDKDWHHCIIKDANEHSVSVIQTDSMGYQDPHRYKFITILNPTEDTFAKAM